MVTLTVNGKAHMYDGDPDMPLLWYLRDDLRLTGTRFGCGAGLCGACTVHVDGKAVRSCQTKMSTLEAKTVLTIDALAVNGAMNAVQKARGSRTTCRSAATASRARSCRPRRCSRRRRIRPTQDIDRAMAGNICRCGTYQRIRAAIHTAAKERA